MLLSGPASQAAAGAAGRPRLAPSTRRAPNKAGSVSLLDLLEVGLISPGTDNLTISYKGITYTASLLRDGTIEYQGQIFQTASALGIHCKRQITPNKQGDDGWKSVHFKGRPLDHFRWGPPWGAVSGLSAINRSIEAAARTRFGLPVHVHGCALLQRATFSYCMYLAGSLLALRGMHLLLEPSLDRSPTGKGHSCLFMALCTALALTWTART